MDFSPTILKPIISDMNLFFPIKIFKSVNRLNSLRKQTVNSDYKGMIFFLNYQCRSISGFLNINYQFNSRKYIKNKLLKNPTLTCKEM